MFNEHVAKHRKENRIISIGFLSSLNSCLIPGVEKKCFSLLLHYKSFSKHFKNDNVQNKHVLADEKKKTDDKMLCGTEDGIRLSKDRKLVGIGENADHQHFLLFMQCFPVASSST